MAVQKIKVEDFLGLAIEHPILDVRSPAEYSHAHIPGACSMPLFSDEERKITGTTYKQNSREDAIKIGLDFFGPKMRGMIEQTEDLLRTRSTEYPTTNTVLVHCWRGGMRSAGVAWLLDLYGFKVFTLAGGYKAFRQWTLQQFEKEYSLQVVGGFTGSGKTKVLAEMKKSGASVIDLEDLASHKGSAFGAINMPLQPSQEMFENKLAVELWRFVEAGNNNRNRIQNKSELSDTETFLTDLNNQPHPILWVEDESQRIGNVNIPLSFWKQIRGSSLLFLQVPFDERLAFLIQDYGKGDKDKLIEAVIRIQKRLGGLEAKTAIDLLQQDNLREAFRILLHYYDKQYKKGLHSRENYKELVTEVACEKVDAAANAQKISQIKTQKETA